MKKLLIMLCFGLICLVSNNINAEEKVKVTFMYDTDTPYTISGDNMNPYAPVQTVDTGSKLTEPQPPNIPNGKVSFRGWSIYDPAFRTEPYLRNDFWGFDIDTVSDDMTLYAVFSENYLISYKNGDLGGNMVVQTREVAPNGIVEGPDEDIVENIPVPNGKKLLYWYIEGEDSSIPFDFNHVRANSDLILIPYFADAYLVLFNSNGGDFVNPQFINKGSKISVPTNPTRAGYTFKYWSLTSDGEPFDFNTIIDEMTILYAVWESNHVNYHVVYWLEKGNLNGDPGDDINNYEYYDSTIVNINNTVLRVKAGDKVELDDTKLNALNQLKTFPGFYSNNNSYTSYYKVVSPTIKGDGSSIVNVYFKRKTYDIIFDINGGAIADTARIDTTTTSGYYEYHNSEYVIHAKVGMDISDIFPALNLDSHYRILDRSTTPSYFVQFVPQTNLLDNTAWISKRPTLTDRLLPTNGDTSFVVAAEYSNNNTVTSFNYMLETLDENDPNAVTYRGKKYVKDLRYSELKYRFGSYTNAYQKPIDGFTSVGTNGNNATGTNPGTFENPHQLNLYYDRLTYTLSFNLGSAPGSITSISNVKYEQDLSLFEPSNPVWENHEFLGWYLQDPTTNVSAVKFDFNNDNQMPNNNLMLFAKWSSKDVRVKFYDEVNGEYLGEDHDKYVGNGETLADPNYYIIGHTYDGKGQFLGWNWLVLDQYPVAFGFDNQQLTDDINLYASWKKDGFTVKYDVGEGSGVAPIDDNIYAANSKSRVLPGYGYVIPPEGKVFIGWISVYQFEEGTGVLSYPYNLHLMDGDVLYRAVYAEKSQSLEGIYHPVIESATPHDDVTLWYPINSDITLAGHIYSSQDYELIGWAESEEKATSLQAQDYINKINDNEIASGTDGYYTLESAYKTGEEEINFYAIWQVRTVDITFKIENIVEETSNRGYFLNDGNQVDEVILSDIKMNELWSNIAVPEPIANYGYSFDKWDQEFPNKITSSKVYIAKFVKNNYKVTFDSGDHGVSDDVIYDIPYLENTPEPPALEGEDGYHFVGWTPEIEDQVTEDITYVAIWEPNEYEVIVDPNIEAEKEEDLILTEIPFGDDIEDNLREKELLTSTREDYTLVGYSLDKEGNKPITNLKMPAKNITVYAQWQKTTINKSGNEDMNIALLFINVLLFSSFSFKVLASRNKI